MKGDVFSAQGSRTFGRLSSKEGSTDHALPRDVSALASHTKIPYLSPFLSILCWFCLGSDMPNDDISGKATSAKSTTHCPRRTSIVRVHLASLLTRWFSRQGPEKAVRIFTHLILRSPKVPTKASILRRLSVPFIFTGPKEDV